MAGCLYRAKDIIDLTSRIDGRLWTYIDYARNRIDLAEVTNYDILNDEKTKYVFLALRQDLPLVQDDIYASIVVCFEHHEKDYFTIHTIWGNVVAEEGDLSSCKIKLTFSGTGLDFKWRSMAEFATYIHGIEEQVLKLHRKLKLKARDERMNAIRGAMDEYDR